MSFLNRLAVLSVLATLMLGIIPGTAFSACRTGTAGWNHMQTGTVEISNAQHQQIRLTARIANDPAERAAGFQYICPQQFRENTIMFLFSTPIQARFHMRNVYAPLDIAFFDNTGKIIKIMTMRPADWEKNGVSRLYGPSRRFRYALEARVGFFSEHNIEAVNSRLLNGKRLLASG